MCVPLIQKQAKCSYIGCTDSYHMTGFRLDHAMEEVLYRAPLIEV